MSACMRRVALALVLISLTLGAACQSDTLTIRPWAGPKDGLYVTRTDLSICLTSTPFDLEEYTRNFYQSPGVGEFITLAQSSFDDYKDDIYRCLCQMMDMRRGLPVPCPTPPATASPPPPTTTPPVAPTPTTGPIPWQVCGVVVDTRYAPNSEGQPTFLNIGRPYPDPERFTVVIWGRDRLNFPADPEVYYKGKTICVNGHIRMYGKSPQIEASNRTQITER